MAQFTVSLQASPLTMLDKWGENLWFPLLARDPGHRQLKEPTGRRLQKIVNF
jgi:hypothetical protein